MNWYRKELTSAIITMLLFFTILAIWTGDYLDILKGLGTAFIVFGSIWITWRGVFKILDKMFPEVVNKTYTLGSNKEAIKVDYSFDK